MAQGDIPDERAEITLSEAIGSHSSLMHETRANEQSAHNLARHSAWRNFDQEDPIEAAAVEVILQA